MFNVGGGEFLVIALIALIVLGPKRLPDAARQVGKAMGELRRLSSGFQNEMRDAFSADEADPTSLAPAARRDPFTAAPAPSPPVDAAIDAVSKRAPRRRAPLRAAPMSASPPLPKGPAARGKGA